MANDALTAHSQAERKQFQKFAKHIHTVCTCLCVEAAWASGLAARSQQQQQQVRVIEICVQQFNELWHASAWATIELASFCCFSSFSASSFSAPSFSAPSPPLLPPLAHKCLHACKNCLAGICLILAPRLHMPSPSCVCLSPPSTPLSLVNFHP